MEDREEVHELLKGLSERDASAVRMGYLESRSYAEIGEALGISENSVGSILARAKQALNAKKKVQS